MNLIFLLSMLLTMNDKPVPRQVLLFYSQSANELRQKQQLEFQANTSGMTERDIVVRSFEMLSSNEAIMQKWKIDPKAAFTFILIGRDGGEKYRSAEFVKTEQLFALIDAMPMRQNERNRSGRKD